MSRSPSTIARKSRAALSYLILAAVAGSFLACASPRVLQAAEPAPALRTAVIATIQQGKVTVIRGVSEFDAQEGMRLLADDIVRTGQASFLRLEYEDHSWLELGPETELQLRPLNSRRGKRPGLYLLHGWLKLQGQPGLRSGQGIALPGADLADLSGVLVVHLDAQSCAVFAEGGTASWVEESAHGAATATNVLRSGDFLTVGPDKTPRIQSRPSAQFVELLPRQYRDTLPARYSIYANNIVPAPKEQRGFSYAEVEPWLNGETGIRRQFVASWRRKTHEAEFRDSLDRQMQMHPEWDPVLHPEKYEPPEQAKAPGQPQQNPPAMSSAGSVSIPR